MPTIPSETVLYDRLASKPCPNCLSNISPQRFKTRPKTLRCKICRKDYSALTGTPFAHSKAPLRLWAALLKNPRETTWHLVHRYHVDKSTVLRARKKLDSIPSKWRFLLLYGNE